MHDKSEYLKEGVMAIARKCDRCGQFYDAPKDDEVCGFVWLTGCGGMSFKNVDLCPDCTDKLGEWLEGVRSELGEEAEGNACAP